MDPEKNYEKLRELKLYRQLLLFAGFVYSLWWFIVNSLLPEAINPIPGRLVVVLTILSIFGLSYLSAKVRLHLRFLFIACVWILTFHYYYLFYENQGDINWVIGCYITVTAIGFYLLSRTALFSYSVFVLILSAILMYLVPSLRVSVFLPGLLTILIQANLGLMSRLGIIKTLADSNIKFQLLFNSTFEGVLVHEDRKITQINESLTRMMGYAKDELIGKDTLDIIHADEKKIVGEKISRGEVLPYETKRAAQRWNLYGHRGPRKKL